MREMEVQMEQMRMHFEAAQSHKEAMQPPEPEQPAKVPAGVA